MTTPAEGRDVEPLLVEAADGIATLTLNRPGALNALNRELKDALLEAVKRVGRDRSVRVVVMTGAGRAFSSGQDLREAGDSASAPSLAVELRERYNPLILALRRLEKPVIAAINGVAAGAGVSLALACDLRLAAEEASFVLAFGRIGLVPDSGLTWFLPRLVGPARAAELMFTTDPLSAREAERLGVVNRVVPGPQLLDETLALARRLASAAPRSLALTKRALNRSMEVGLEEALAYEASMQGIAGTTADHREGVQAFREKRPPRFSGE
jgi:2-(1,2-epoxy-1,2-dihydrophenyl)acetyl-CoA isomerase